MSSYPIGTRISIDGQSGTIVHYADNISQTQPNSYFYGIDWDNYTIRGRHNGFVNGKQVFVTPLNSCTFLSKKTIHSGNKLSNIAPQSGNIGIAGSALLFNVLSKYTTVFEDDVKKKFNFDHFYGLGDESEISLTAMRNTYTEIYQNLFGLCGDGINTSDGFNNDDNNNNTRNIPKTQHNTQNSQINDTTGVYLHQLSTIYKSKLPSLASLKRVSLESSNLSHLFHFSEHQQPPLARNPLQKYPLLQAMLPKLTHIALQHNNLSDLSIIPKLLLNIPSLESIDLSGNPIGVIPYEIHQGESDRAVGDEKINGGELNTKKIKFEKNLDFIDPITGSEYKILDIPNFPWDSFIYYDDETQKLDFYTNKLKSLSLSSIPTHIREKNHHIAEYYRKNEFTLNQSNLTPKSQCGENTDNDQTSKDIFMHPLSLPFRSSSLFNTPWHWILLLASQGALNSLTELEMLNSNLESFVGDIVIPVKKMKQNDDDDNDDDDDSGQQIQNISNPNPNSPPQPPNLLSIIPIHNLEHVLSPNIQQMDDKCDLNCENKIITFPPHFFPNLKSLILNENFLTWDNVSSLSQLPNLDTMEINNNSINYITFYDYESKFDCLGEVETQNIQNCEQIPFFPKLRRLFLNSNPLESMESIQNLTILPSLEVLSIINNHTDNDPVHESNSNLQNINSDPKTNSLTHSTPPSPTPHSSFKPVNIIFPIFPSKFIRSLTLILLPNLKLLNFKKVTEKEKRELSLTVPILIEFFFNGIIKMILNQKEEMERNPYTQQQKDPYELLHVDYFHPEQLPNKPPVSVQVVEPLPSLLDSVFGLDMGQSYPNPHQNNVSKITHNFVTFFHQLLHFLHQDFLSNNHPTLVLDKNTHIITSVTHNDIITNPIDLLLNTLVHDMNVLHTIIQTPPQTRSAQQPTHELKLKSREDLPHEGKADVIGDCYIIKLLSGLFSINRRPHKNGNIWALSEDMILTQPNPLLSFCQSDFENRFLRFFLHYQNNGQNEDKKSKPDQLSRNNHIPSHADLIKILIGDYITPKMSLYIFSHSNSNFFKPPSTSQLIHVVVDIIALLYCNSPGCLPHGSGLNPELIPPICTLFSERLQEYYLSQFNTSDTITPCGIPTVLSNHDCNFSAGNLTKTQPQNDHHNLLISLPILLQFELPIYEFNALISSQISLLTKVCADILTNYSNNINTPIFVDLKSPPNSSPHLSSLHPIDISPDTFHIVCTHVCPVLTPTMLSKKECSDKLITQWYNQKLDAVYRNVLQTARGDDTKTDIHTNSPLTHISDHNLPKFTFDNVQFSTYMMTNHISAYREEMIQTIQTNCGQIFPFFDKINTLNHNNDVISRNKMGINDHSSVIKEDEPLSQMFPHLYSKNQFNLLFLSFIPTAISKQMASSNNIGLCNRGEPHAGLELLDF
jgi:hypothetical protein